MYPPIESLRLRKLSLEARFQTRMQLQQAGAARRISVRFAEAAALPCVQDMRGAIIIILRLMISLIRIRRGGGSAWGSKSTARGCRRLENNDLEEESEIIS